MKIEKLNMKEILLMMKLKMEDSMIKVEIIILVNLKNGNIMEK